MPTIRFKGIENPSPEDLATDVAAGKCQVDELPLAIRANVQSILDARKAKAAEAKPAPKTAKKKKAKK